MHVAVCTIELFIPAAGSLKEKRHAVKSIIERIRSHVNASVAETDLQDCWQRAVVGVAMVSGSKTMLDRQVNVIRGIVDDCADVETASFTVEYV